jgi:sugar phosphate isomerase/epimerase
MSVRVSVGSSAFLFGVYEKNPIPLDRVLKRLQELAFQGVELVGMTPYADPDEVKTPGDRSALKKKIGGYGLGISNYGADFKERSPASPDAGERKDYRKLFTKNLQFCVDLNIPSVRVDTVHEPPLRPGVSYEDAWRWFVDTFQECAEEAQKEGVLVVWEFEPGVQFNRPSEIVKMAEEVAHDNFRVLFDSCHAHMCASRGSRQEEPVEVLPGGEVELAGRLEGRIGYVHLIDSDNTLHDGWTSTHAPFGRGVIDFDTLVPVLVGTGYDNPWWTIDLCFWPQAWDILEDSKKFMDGLLTRHGLL